jgi:iron complex outermembrane recepter protein
MCRIMNVLNHFVILVIIVMKIIISIALLWLTSHAAFSQDIYEPENDTAKIRNLRIDEITVRSPKYNSNIFQLPAAATMMTSRIIENYQIGSLPDISGLVPNFFMPDYGSKLTSPVYIRGIGTRINTPSVGLYVDNIPYFEKSAFNFDFFDLERIEVLRGPQGTLYGRNTMGGLVNIFTTDPSSERHTSLRLSYGNYNQVNTSVLHNQPLSNKMALMMNFNQLHNGGFYTNAYSGDPVDKLNSYSGRIKLLYTPAERLRIQYNFQFENNDQGGYPYAIYDKTKQEAKEINYDHWSGYKRTLISNGLNIEYSGAAFRLRAVTSYQFMDDEQDIDQDFTPSDMFFVGQWQTQNMVAQEISLQSYENDRYEWLTGVFAFHQTLDKLVDVTYGKVMQAAQRLPGELVVSKTYDNSNSGFALFHQSTIKFGKLSLMGGIRADFERARLDYQHYRILVGNSTQMEDVQSSVSFSEFLPKVALQYNINTNITPYATISKGYNAGGFNSTFEREEDRSFKPEQSWNYEAGLKARFLGNRLFTNIAYFIIDWENQQIYQPVPSGQGSMLKNAGKSESRGFEMEIKAVPVTNLEIWTTAGFNRAKFVEYIRSATLDYSGNFLPYVPEWTGSIGGNYTLNVNRPLLQNIHLYSVYQIFGKHYWHEDNSAWQEQYGLLSSRISFTHKNAELAFWGKNMLNTNYNSFYFTALNNAYVQVGKPASMGISLKFMF